MTRLVMTVDDGAGQAYEVPTSNAGTLRVEIEPVPSGVPSVPVDVDATAAAVGSSGAAATADHKHHLAVGSPVAVALANADGLASTAARSDHVHALTAAIASQVYAANWAVADWYIDGTVGNDGNNGTDPGTPLRTGAELCRRLGPYALWGQSVTVHVLANGMTDNLNLRGCMLVAGTQLDVIGTPTVLATDIVAAFANLSHVVPSATQLTATAIADWTPFVGQRVRFTSGAADLAVSWIGGSNPGGIGTNVAQVTRLSRLALTDTQNLHNTSVITPVFGASFVVESLPYVPMVSIKLDGQLLQSAGPQWPVRLWTIQDIDCPQLQVEASDYQNYARSIVFGCAVGNINQKIPNPSAAISVRAGCNVKYLDFASGYGLLNISGGYFCCLYSVPLLRVQQGSVLNSAYGLHQNSRLQIFGGADVTAQDSQFFDVVSTSACLSVLSNAVLTLSNFSGARNAGIGLQFQNNSRARTSGSNNLLATVTPAQLSTTSVINLTMVQALQTSDYAQKGTTPAMVAGATTVTVTWYDNVAQKVTATHAAFGGTPGILSVTQTSTTQFTITSSSALDTSTVNWQISPLGRNIFVSTS
jgi:hypothetical protein